ncbi:MAG TPA: hypothetical protein PKC47_12545 [Petrimonas sp.]|nr:hypothetical protein [Petrimonas sp.]
MTIEIFTVCDYAQPFGGSVNILNPFEAVRVSELPSTKSFSIVVRIRYEPEEDANPIVLRIINPENNDMIPPFTNNSPLETSKDRTSCINHVISLQNMPLSSLGRYMIMIESNGQNYTLPFYIEKVEEN